jgi:hypothetical protein
MREYVGVVDPFILATEDRSSVSQLKRHALMFSRLAIPSPPDGLLSSGAYNDVIAELEWLLAQDIVFELKVEERWKFLTSEHEEAYEAMMRHMLGLIATLFGVDLYKIRQAKLGRGPKLSKEEIDELHRSTENIIKIKSEDIERLIESETFSSHAFEMVRHLTRFLSIMLREKKGVDAYPVLASQIPLAHESPATKNDVVQIILESLPLPDDSTPWEQIIEFRNDPDSYNKFVDLRNWMSEVARAALSPAEIEEKLEHLLRQFQRHMEIHKMKTNMGTLETILVTTGEVIENFATLKIGQGAKALFAAKQRKIALLEGELTSPGSEVAYIVKAREAF